MPDLSQLDYKPKGKERSSLLGAPDSGQAAAAQPPKPERKKKERADIFAGEETFSTSLKMLKRQQKGIKRLLLEEKPGLPTTQEGIIAAAIDEFLKKHSSKG